MPPSSIRIGMRHAVESAGNSLWRLSSNSQITGSSEKLHRTVAAHAHLGPLLISVPIA